MPLDQQVAQQGYMFESYKVLTEDGYVLTLFRVPGRLDEQQREGKQPVYMQHGLCDDGGTWLFHRRDDSLAL